MVVLALFFTEIEPIEVNVIGCMIVLPKSKNFQKTIYKCHQNICKEIIKLSSRDMMIAMGEKIRANIITDKGKYYCNQPESIGIVIYYAMGWQKRASGHSYSTNSRYTCFVGIHASDCVVYSMSCKKYELKPTNDKRKVKGRGGKENEDRNGGGKRVDTDRSDHKYM